MQGCVVHVRYLSMHVCAHMRPKVHGATPWRLPSLLNSGQSVTQLEIQSTLESYIPIPNKKGVSRQGAKLPVQQGKKLSQIRVSVWLAGHTLLMHVHPHMTDGARCFRLQATQNSWTTSKYNTRVSKNAVGRRYNTHDTRTACPAQDTCVAHKACVTHRWKRCCQTVFGMA